MHIILIVEGGTRAENVEGIVVGGAAQRQGLPPSGSYKRSARNEGRQPLAKQPTTEELALGRVSYNGVLLPLTVYDDDNERRRLFHSLVSSDRHHTLLIIRRTNNSA